MSYMKNVGPNPNSKYHQGEFIPTNPQKYHGRKGSKIIYRSGLELKFCQKCDTEPNIIRWASEELAIPYMHPFKKKQANYYPDYIVDYKTKDGGIKRIIIEVKAGKFLEEPPKLSKFASTKQKKNHAYHKKMYILNMVKFLAARKYCAVRGWSYHFLTESFFGG